jgi:cathepsin L
LYVEEEKGFIAWMRDYNQMYTGEEYWMRLGVWMTNARYVNEFKGPFEVGLNHLSALTPAEFKTMLGYVPYKGERHAVKSEVKYSPSWDWREKGFVNHIKDQAQCGSCWAFSCIQASETGLALKTGKLLILSEKELIDCVKVGARGCKGGNMNQAYEWVRDQQQGKYALESDYPYVPVTGICHFDITKGVGTCTGILWVVQGDEDDLAVKCELYGSVSVSIDAGRPSFRVYKKGVYDDPTCSSVWLDHGVGCVGWGTEDGKRYWIVRNSWGTKWGDKGYAKMIWKNNQCGIATDSCIPLP